MKLFIEDTIYIKKKKYNELFWYDNNIVKATVATGKRKNNEKQDVGEKKKKMYTSKNINDGGTIMKKKNVIYLNGKYRLLCLAVQTLRKSVC